MSWGVSDLTVAFGDTTALSKVDLAVEPGVIAVVVGGDGAGKTTLGRSLGGLEAPSKGSIQRPKRVGYQPSTSGVWRDLTVHENLQLVAGAYGLESTRARSRIDELL